MIEAIKKALEALERGEVLCEVTAANILRAAIAERQEESPEFIKRTNKEYAAWCATFYSADALDERGMRCLHGLWAWQEQERRKGQVLVMHPDDPHLRLLDGQLVYVQRTIRSFE